ncbi:hypothetical protein R5R35_010910 [Gryllus longicercus]|uniref:NADPH:adrenodoxin oxidoreductase, mitochondrial n=1 Tax=Gryllus longicercus TaxID=2509291 RepID=A0AAN9V5C0_9ORTH
MHPLGRVLAFSQKCRRFSTNVIDPNSIQPKLCVVGSGPASFYAAQQILKALPKVQIDIFERLPVPFGLVRFGVAPDHPEVKNVINTFTKTAQDPRVKFIGNVKLGQDVSLAELQNAYHSVLLAYGAEEDRLLGIPGENLDNILSAREFVGWYNGLPNNKDLKFNLNIEKVAIIGQGNVALDVARILLSPIDLLKKTDITEYSLAALADSKVKEVKLIGRRGPLQVAFTIKEFREMLRLPRCFVNMNAEDFAGLDAIVPNLPRPRKRLTELLMKSISTSKETEADKCFNPIFFRTPKSFQSGEDASSVGALTVAVNTMEGENAVETDVLETIECGLVLRSIGYKSIQADSAIPFNSKRGLVENSGGVIQPGLYVSGWLGTGPVGVILSTMTNAFAVGQTMASDILNNTVDASIKKPGFEFIGSLLKKKGIQTVSFADWEQIDKVEQSRGKEKGKLREKIVDVKEMLTIASGKP